MKIYDVSRLPSSITLGWDGENNWRPIAFDCSALLTGHPEAVVTLWLLPKGETQAFLVALERDGNTVVWTPLNEEMTAERGQLQIVVQDGTDVGKSKVVDYTVHDSLVGGADHPAENPSWATQVVEDVTEAAGHYPYIGTNGNWFVWDITEGEWVDTGVAAGGGDIDPEDIADAVADYLEEHPIEVTETDPTVPAWAKAAQKPSYTAQEVGALPDSYTPPVTSVNGKTGAVVLDAEDVGALPDDTVIPSAVTESTVSGWGFTKNTGTYSKPSGGIPASDLAAGVIPTVDSALSTTSTNPVQNKVVKAALDGKGTYSKPAGGIPASDLADNMPFFTLPEGGQSGQALLSDGANGAYWGQAQGGGTGLTEDVKQALLDCFENVAWVNDQGQTYYDALYAALYPSADVLSISAVFTQGSAVIYDTDNLDTLKQYLTVTATMPDSTTRTVTGYTLSGTLTEGTSTITVLYNGKTTTFNVVVTNHVRLPSKYQEVEYVENPSGSGNGAYFDTNVNFPLNFSAKIKCYKSAAATGNARVVFGWSETKYFGMLFYSTTSGKIGSFMLDSNLTLEMSNLYDSPLEYDMNVNGAGLSVAATAKNNAGHQSNEITFTDSSYTGEPIKVFYYGSTINQFNGRIYSLEVTNTDNNTKILELIPCYRKSDSVVGMYDMVNDVFYTSKTSVAFLKGADV